MLDASTHEVIPGVTVLLKGTTTGVATGYDGHFELRVPRNEATRVITVSFRSIGYVTEEREVRVGTGDVVINMPLSPEVLGGPELCRPPRPWHPRRFYHRSKYWLMRPFRHG
ncbi:carboxypeptidase-like regulatory domain-containing protein [Hymenobacter sp.]|uniref:carboxypeptidase-like regulatory domain-containing protein n=1 Tax=Hymenobacter sp. TaxID=1898978 RepID=UPI00286CB063|nr:carboxypeptidase-like regulatory domain-containing protein [Hymenobacter sp.]